MSRLVLAIDSRLDEVPALGHRVRQLCINDGVAADEAALVELAVVEAVQNTIEHGYGMHPGSHVSITVEVNGHSIEAEILDDGRPVDLLRVRRRDGDPVLDRHDLDERGRGLEIIRGVFEDVTFLREDNRNRLRLRRQRGAS